MLKSSNFSPVLAVTSQRTQQVSIVKGNNNLELLVKFSPFGPTLMKMSNFAKCSVGISDVP